MQDLSKILMKAWESRQKPKILTPFSTSNFLLTFFNKQYYPKALSNEGYKWYVYCNT